MTVGLTSQSSGSEGSAEAGGKEAKKNAGDAVKIKDEPGVARSTPVVGDSQPDVVDLTNSPPPARKRSSANSTVRKQATIKPEPEDLGTVNFKRPALNENSMAESHEGKKIKLEPKAASPIAFDDPDLAALEDEIKREEEELAITQRAAQLMRQTNEKKAKLAALQQAKRNGTPVSK